MKMKDMLSPFMAVCFVFVLVASLICVPSSSDPVPKMIFGQVLANSTTGSNPYPGNATFYIQNRTSEQKDYDWMIDGGGGFYYYGSAVDDTIID